MSAEHATAAHSGEHEGMTKKKIWYVFWVLFAITALEFILALAVPETIMSQGIKNIIYIVLTLMKAFYIVGYFMHLKFENLGLIYCIVVPMIFIVGFIVSMLYEGNYWLFLR